MTKVSGGMIAIRQSTNTITVGITHTPTPTWIVFRAVPAEINPNRRSPSAAIATAPT